MELERNILLITGLTELEIEIFIILDSLKRRVELCKTLAPRKLYTQQKLKSLAIKYNK